MPGIKLLRRITDLYWRGFGKTIAQGDGWSIKRHKRWRYFDLHKDRLPHFVLYDSEGKARFTMRVAENDLLGLLNVASVERERTKLKPGGRDLKHDWDRKAENLAAQKLKKELGMHPQEHLFSEMLRYYKGRLVRPSEPFMLFIEKSKYDSHPKAYGGLRDRFLANRPIELFEDTGDEEIGSMVYPLNFGKRRVKEALSLE